MVKEEDYELGDRVEHLVSKSRGIISGIQYHEHSATAFFLEKEIDTEDKKSGKWVELGNSKLIDKGAVVFPTPAPSIDTCLFKMNDEVECKITKYKGIVQSIARYDTGCLHVGIQSSKLTKDGEIPKLVFRPETSVIMKNAAEVKKKDPNKPGGPVDRPY